MGIVYNITCKQGNTYKGATFTVSVDDVPINLVGAHLLLQLKLTPTSSPVLSLTELDSLEITLVDGQFKILPQLITVPVAEYLYDVRITFADGIVRSDFIHGTWTVEQVISDGA